MATSQQLPGYRVLSPEERAHVEQAKQFEAHLLKFLHMIEADAMYDADPRWFNIAKTHFEQGFMALTRSITRPNPVQPE